MNILIRYLRAGPEGVAEYQDIELAADAVKIGSAADRSIQLLGRAVGAKHATLSRAGAGLAIRGQGGHKVRLNDREVSGGPVAVGDRIEIGGHQLRLVNPPAGFEIALEVQLNTSADASEFESAFKTNLEQTWLTKRGGAWALAALTLLFGLLIPLSTVYLHRQGRPTPAGLPDDTFWTAGPLSAAHEHAAGRKCSACHQQLFVHVQDTACRKCHESVQDHVSVAHLALTRLGPPGRCEQCHREHDGGASQLALRDDPLCVNCHADSTARFGTLKVASASGFAKGVHPAFFVTLQTPAPGTAAAPAANGAALQWVTRREPVASAREESNLKFSHAQHLDRSHVSRASDGGALGCADCHTLGLDGEHFVPVTMARSCAACHALTFDANNPARQLPHGKPLEAMLEIEDYYARKFSDPTLPPVVRTAPERRLPDRENNPAPLPDTCTGPSYVCANRRALTEIETQFTGRGCVSCHVVTDTHEKDPHDRFLVLPVRLTTDYFSDVHFSHRAHAIQKDLTGDEACLSCHKARDSKQSTDVMIPDIDNCLACHADSHATQKDRITMQCVSCHAYHPMAIMQAKREGQ